MWMRLLGCRAQGSKLESKDPYSKCGCGLFCCFAFFTGPKKQIGNLIINQKILSRIQSGIYLCCINTVFAFLQELKKQMQCEHLSQVKQQISEELTCYLRLGHASQLGSSPLSFWKNRRSELPFLSALARIIYSIPASTAALERLFSAAGRAVCHRRPRLNVRKAAKLIFAHANVARNITGRIGAKKPVEE